MPDGPFQFSHAADRLIADLRGIGLPPRSTHTIGGTRARFQTRPACEIATLVEELLVKHQIGRASPEQSIREHWTDIVGSANAAYSHAAQIDARGRLAVLVSHPVVRSELLSARELILTRIRALPGCDHVRELTLRTG
jgi:hypothetical protein